MAEGGQVNDAPGGKGSRDPRIFVLLRELSEVHLLLDNVSASSSKTVSETAAIERPEGLPADWIEKVCEISWPPDGSKDEKAGDAALLIRAKDHLNRLSQPASGASIAFTLLVTQGPSKEGWWRRRRAEGDTHTRHSLAETAYPDLIAKATGFRRVMSWISAGLVVALIVTCALSWYVAYGNAALAEYAASRAAVGLRRPRERARRPAGHNGENCGKAPEQRRAVASAQYCASPTSTSGAALREWCGRRRARLASGVRSWTVGDPSRLRG